MKDLNIDSQDAQYHYNLMELCMHNTIDYFLQLHACVLHRIDK